MDHITKGSGSNPAKQEAHGLKYTGNQAQVWHTGKTGQERSGETHEGNQEGAII